MSTPEDMAACQCRNTAGYPSMFAQPGGAITGSYMDNSRGKNDALPWVVLSCVLGAMALMGVLLMPGLIDAKVKGNAATCDLALKTAYTAKDQVDYEIAKRKVQEKLDGKR